MRRYHDKLAGAPLSDAERGEYPGAFRHGLTQSSYLMVVTGRLTGRNGRT